MAAVRSSLPPPSRQGKSRWADGQGRRSDQGLSHTPEEEEKEEQSPDGLCCEGAIAGAVKQLWYSELVLGHRQESATCFTSFAQTVTVFDSLKLSDAFQPEPDSAPILQFLLFLLSLLVAPVFHSRSSSCRNLLDY